MINGCKYILTIHVLSIFKFDHSRFALIILYKNVVRISCIGKKIEIELFCIS
jgi:hypothetical protein